MARKVKGKVEKVADSATSANGVAEKQRVRNEMWYAIVGMKEDGTDLKVMAIKPTVGQARKLYADMNATFLMVYPRIRIIRCVVVPSVKPVDEPDESETER